MSEIYQYDKLIEVFGYTGEQWPQMRLFLNMVKENYYANNNSGEFRKTDYPEVNSKFYVNPNQDFKMTSAKNDTVSNQFACFLQEFLVYINSTTLQNLDGENTPEERLAAFKEGLSSEWFKEFLFNITDTTNPVQLEGSTLTGNFPIKFKGRQNIIKDLKLENLFNNLTFENESETGTKKQNIFTRAISFSDISTQLALFSTTRGICQKFRGEGKPIGFKFDKYLLKLLLETAVETKLNQSQFFETVSTPLALENKYYRRVGDFKNLYTELNGKEVAVQIGSEEYMKLVKSDNCFNLGIKSSDPNSKTECSNFVLKCLGGQNIEECKNFMLKNTFWKDVNEEISKMNPDMACELLRKFAFPTVEQLVPEVGLKLNMFVNTTLWLDSLKEREFEGSKLGSKISFSDDELIKISSNRELIGYLDALVSFVNKNPGILNTGYAKGQLSTNPNAFKGTSLSKFGLSGKVVTQSTIAPSVSSVVALQSTIRQNKVDIASVFGLPNSNLGFNLQRGGGVTLSFFESFQDKFSEPLRLSTIFEKHMTGFINAMKNVNKQISSNDLLEINKLVSELKVLEEKLLKTAIYTTKYHNLVSVFGQEDTNGIITLDNLQKFVDKRNSYFQRTNLKQDAISILVEKIAEIVQKEVNTGKTVQYPTPKN